MLLPAFWTPVSGIRLKKHGAVTSVASRQATLAPVLLTHCIAALRMAWPQMWVFLLLKYDTADSLT